VIALLTQADQQSRAQQLDAASATLERALRLDPRNAELWYRLAKLRLDQRRPEQAQSLAYKSISLAGRNNRLLQMDWQLIAQAKALLGDTAGSQQAAARAQALQP
jgi:predicted Zn-dependent protease